MPEDMIAPWLLLLVYFVVVCEALFCLGIAVYVITTRIFDRLNR